MRICQLKLVRFGHFADFTLDLGERTKGSDFHVVLGRNEAGKTTIAEAWLNLLYGFPNKTPYAFRHQRASLEVGADVQDGEQTFSLTRLPTKTNNLVDQNRSPVSAAVLDSLLKGVGKELYRSLYCLDDETIETGGEDILASEGDLGRLLFSAATGLATFSKDLEAERELDRAFQVRGPGSRSTVLANAKKRLEEIETERAGLDVSVREYRKRLTVVEAARTADTDARDWHEAVVAGAAGLQALLSALPLRDDLNELRGRLSDLGNLPSIDPASAGEMEDLAKSRSVIMGSMRSSEAEIARRTAERKRISVTDAERTLTPQLAALKSLHGHASSGEADLPNRREDLAVGKRNIDKCLRDLGLTGPLPLEQLTIPGPVLNAIDQAARRRDTANDAVENARRELEAAKRQLDDALLRLGDKSVAPPDPTSLEALLSNSRTVDMANRLSDAVRKVQQAQETLESTLLSLGVGSYRFDRCPGSSITIGAAQALVEKLHAIEASCSNDQDALKSGSAKIERLRARLGGLADQGIAPNDADAATSRQTRDDRWAIHREALTPESADDFAASMAEDDQSTALRLADANRLADLRGTELDLSEATVEQTLRHSALEAAQAELASANETLVSHLRALGLPEGMGSAALVDWLRLHEQASLAEHRLANANTALASAEEAAMPLRLELQQAVRDDGEPDLSRLIARAGRRAAEQRREHDAYNADLERIATAQGNCSTRDKALAIAQPEATTAEQALFDAVQLLKLPISTDLHIDHALPVLRELSAAASKQADLVDRVEKIEANIAHFSRQIHEIASPWPTLLDKPPLAIAAELAAIEADAAKRLALFEENERQIRDVSSRLSIAKDDLAQIEERAAELADHLPEASADFDQISTAVAAASEATGLRTAIRKAENHLASTLGCTAEMAEEGLKGRTPASLQAELNLLDPEIAAAQSAHNQAIGDLREAENDLAGISGDAEAARLQQDRQAELDLLAEQAEQALIRRLALIMSERAVARYRDRHRGEMMADTEAAFAMLTDGAYPGLSTQPTDKGDVLIAHRATDGRTLRADEASMSKGTRFQLYLALRLAGYRQMAASGRVLPFLCDDVFETFDEGRTAAACKLMHEMAGIGQAVYFTHHAHVADIAQKVCGDRVQIHEI